MLTYTLPDLSYDPGALEPHLSGQIVELHHDKHHASYVAGANTALERLASDLMIEIRLVETALEAKPRKA